jgi:bleomycin hydrolase
MKKSVSILILGLLMMSDAFLPALAQDKITGEGYNFTIIKDLPATSVKNQSLTNTCWSFSVISMLESELLRMGKDTFDLSEMYVVRHIYEEKAEKYIRMHGTINFAGGGFFHDVIHVLDTFGMVPDEIYTGLTEGKKIHFHEEMDDDLKEYVEKIVLARNNKDTSEWKEGFTEIIDSCLGILPQEFVFENKSYTPELFASGLNLNLDDYIEITSFNHHPFYQEFKLEVPDNWAWGDFFNVPLDELIEIISYSIDNGYTVAWSADISEKGFIWNTGVAIVPDIPENKITQDLRQEGFDNYATTDDHGMHITGLAIDKKGNKYFRVKNSWGVTGSPYDGYLYASEPYVRLKTIAIMVNKNGIPDHIRQKLHIN